MDRIKSWWSFSLHCFPRTDPCAGAITRSLRFLFSLSIFLVGSKMEQGLRITNLVSVSVTRRKIQRFTIPPHLPFLSSVITTRNHTKTSTIIITFLTESRNELYLSYNIFDIGPSTATISRDMSHLFRRTDGSGEWQSSHALLVLRQIVLFQMCQWETTAWLLANGLFTSQWCGSHEQ